MKSAGVAKYVTVCSYRTLGLSLRIEQSFRLIDVTYANCEIDMFVIANMFFFLELDKTNVHQTYEKSNHTEASILHLFSNTRKICHLTRRQYI